MAEDYVEFCRNISYYVTADLRFIDPKQSKHYENIKGLNAFGKYPIGKIDDIEIMFLHYHSPQEALEKWKRRCERIIWDKMIFKFSDQNGCNEKDAEEFLNLPYKNKLFFSVHDEWELKNKSGYYLIRQRSKGESIKGSYEPMGKNRYFNLTQMINDL